MDGPGDARSDGLVDRYGASRAVERSARRIRLPLVSLCLLALALALTFSMSDVVLLLDRAVALLVELALAVERRGEVRLAVHHSDQHLGGETRQQDAFLS